MINYVIPMAGRGSRFVKAGYNIPKYLIEYKGKKLLEYSLESLPIQDKDNIIFIVLKEHNLQYDLNKEILFALKGKKNFKIIELDTITDGQAETVLKAEQYINNSNDLVIYNIDTYFDSSTLQKLLSSDSKKDGILGAFKIHENDAKWSFAREHQGIVVETAEKIQISDNALTGMYHFTKGSDFVRIAKKNITGGAKNQNEYYIAPMYNDLINEGKEFILDFVEKFIPLGTPEDLKE